MIILNKEIVFVLFYVRDFKKPVLQREIDKKQNPEESGS